MAAVCPAVEFGPVGSGHHGPEEWVSVASLHAYRQALSSSRTVRTPACIVGVVWMPGPP